MKDEKAYLGHIRDSVDRILAYTAAGKKAFMLDHKCQDAVVRNLEIIGEAAKNVPRAVQASHPRIPWRRMAGMRDKMIHEYFGVDLEIVWGVVARELPALRRRIVAMLRAGGKKGLVGIIRKENKAA